MFLLKYSSIVSNKNWQINHSTQCVLYHKMFPLHLWGFLVSPTFHCSLILQEKVVVFAGNLRNFWKQKKLSLKHKHFFLLQWDPVFHHLFFGIFFKNSSLVCVWTVENIQGDASWAILIAKQRTEVFSLVKKEREREEARLVNSPLTHQVTPLTSKSKHFLSSPSHSLREETVRLFCSQHHS